MKAVIIREANTGIKSNLNPTLPSYHLKMFYTLCLMRVRFFSPQGVPHPPQSGQNVVIYNRPILNFYDNEFISK